MFYSNTELANVTTITNLNVYSYAERDLLLSYGIALLASAVAVLLGGYSLYRNGVSHDSSPSTFASTMQSLEVRRPSPVSDLDFQDRERLLLEI